jgi:hypothetical protein
MPTNNYGGERPEDELGRPPGWLIEPEKGGRELRELAALIMLFRGRSTRCGWWSAAGL